MKSDIVHIYTDKTNAILGDLFYVLDKLELHSYYDDYDHAKQRLDQLEMNYRQKKIWYL